MGEYELNILERALVILNRQEESLRCKPLEELLQAQIDYHWGKLKEGKNDK